MSSFILISTENYNTYIYVTISRLPTLGKSNRLSNGKITWCLSTLLPLFFHHYFTQPLHVDAGDLLKILYSQRKYSLLHHDLLHEENITTLTYKLNKNLTHDLITAHQSNTIHTTTYCTSTCAFNNSTWSPSIQLYFSTNNTY